MRNHRTMRRWLMRRRNRRCMRTCRREETCARFGEKRQDLRTWSVRSGWGCDLDFPFQNYLMMYPEGYGNSYMSAIFLSGLYLICLALLTYFSLMMISRLSSHHHR